MVIMYIITFISAASLKEKEALAIFAAIFELAFVACAALEVQGTLAYKRNSYITIIKRRIVSNGKKEKEKRRF